MGYKRQTLANFLWSSHICAFDLCFDLCFWIAFLGQPSCLDTMVFQKIAPSDLEHILIGVNDFEFSSWKRGRWVVGVDPCFVWGMPVPWFQATFVGEVAQKIMEMARD